MAIVYPHVSYFTCECCGHRKPTIFRTSEEHQAFADNQGWLGWVCDECEAAHERSQIERYEAEIEKAALEAEWEAFTQQLDVLARERRWPGGLWTFICQHLRRLNNPPSWEMVERLTRLWRTPNWELRPFHVREDLVMCPCCHTWHRLYT